MQLFAHCRLLPEDFTAPAAAKARCLLDGRVLCRLINSHISVFSYVERARQEVESENMAQNLCVSGVY